ncbi:MAG TPA: deoxyribonuclease V [Sedimentisphaerales bacterium]|nr:deoxyribonuclease V [Sedimentisphaerales bacterium]
MQARDLHSWNLSYSQARDCQKSLASKVQFTPMKKQPKLIAGIDCAFSKDGQKIIAAVIVLKLPDFVPVETANALRRVTFPYIPGLLSFREAPACIAAVKRLKSKPDLFIIDGQGVAHPRRLGLATHLGLFFDKPTIGCAKSRLTGNFEEPSLEKGAYSPLKDKQEVIGAVVRTRTNVKPLFVSVGNKCLLKDAIQITLGCTTKYRLPEPTRLAHQLVSKLRLKA